MSDLVVRNRVVQKKTGRARRLIGNVTVLGNCHVRPGIHQQCQSKQGYNQQSSKTQTKGPMIKDHKGIYGDHISITNGPSDPVA